METNTFKLKKNEKADIEFMDFPFNDKIIQKKASSASKAVVVLMFIIILIVLCVFSSAYNLKSFSNNSRVIYQTKVKVNEGFVNINPASRTAFITNIGFSQMSLENRKYDNKELKTIIATYKYYSDIPQMDTLNIYLNNNDIKVIYLSLIYKPEEYKTEDAVIDLNTILNNLVAFNITKESLKQAEKNNTYHINDDKLNSNIDITYKTSKSMGIEEDYYIVGVNIERK